MLFSCDVWDRFVLVRGADGDRQTACPKDAGIARMESVMQVDDLIHCHEFGHRLERFFPS